MHNSWKVGRAYIPAWITTVRSNGGRGRYGVRARGIGHISLGKEVGSCDREEDDVEEAREGKHNIGEDCSRPRYRMSCEAQPT